LCTLVCAVDVYEVAVGAHPPHQGSLKLKSLAPAGQTGDVALKRLRLDGPIQSASLASGENAATDVDVTSHLAELKREWAAKNRNTAHLKMLLSHTQNYRYLCY